MHAGKCNELAVIISVGRFGTYIIQILLNAQYYCLLTSLINITVRLSMTHFIQLTI